VSDAEQEQKEVETKHLTDTFGYGPGAEVGIQKPKSSGEL